jgi:hypothetical protein
VKTRASTSIGAATLAALFAAGCLADSGTDGVEETTVTAGALDNQVDPDEGKACYQDVPMRKGKMEMGMCCFDDPIKGTSECVVCDKDHHCTKGGAEPGALTIGDRGVVWGAGGAVFDPGTISPSVKVTASVATRAAALSP